jgi:hypothetical protein
MTNSHVHAGAAALALAISVALPLRGEDQADSSSDTQAYRSAEMKHLVEAYRAFQGQGPSRHQVALKREPLHRWNDPTRDFSDGSLWAWGEKGRPIALVAVELYPHPRGIGTGDPTWAFEFVSLSTGALEMDGGAGFDPSYTEAATPGRNLTLRWAPNKAGIELRTIPGAPPPGRSPVVRLAQMRDLVKRFTAREFWNPQTDRRIELRPMPRPIDRYSDPSTGLLDGAIFLFANGTNPEVLLLVEAHEGAEGAAIWRFAVARLTTARAELTLDQKVVWAVPRAALQTPGDVYFTARKRRTARSSER